MLRPTSATAWAIGLHEYPCFAHEATPLEPAVHRHRAQLLGARRGEVSTVEDLMLVTEGAPRILSRARLGAAADESGALTERLVNARTN